MTATAEELSLAEEVTLATARLVLRMQMSTLNTLLQQTDLMRADVEAELAAAIDSAGAAWDQAGQDAAQHLLLVIRTSQKHSLGEILQRPDVQQALSLPFEEAGEATKKLIESAWDNGVAVGDMHADISLSTLGKAPGEWGIPDTTYVDVLKGDVDANVAEAGARIQEALEQPDELVSKIQKVLRDLGRRAQYGVQAAGWKGANISYENSLKAAGVTQMMWVTKFGPNTCERCAKLHGTVVGMGKPFPIMGHVHGGVFKPPVHPNCRCVLVPWAEPMAEEPGPQPHTLREWAKEWWAKRIAPITKA